MCQHNYNKSLNKTKPTTLNIIMIPIYLEEENNFKFYPNNLLKIDL